MDSIRRRWLVSMSCLLVMVFSVPGAACARGSRERDELDLEVIRATLQKLVQRELDKGTASVSLALVKDGEVVLAAAWGHANVWARTPATPETIYCTGSTFKAVTATALLQLAEQGKLDLDAPANDYLGEQRLAADPDDGVTARHLLNHTSGLEAGANTRNVWDRALPMTLEEIPAELDRVSGPGEKYAYNNYAYAVAGLIVEKVSGQSYEDYILEHILRPLGVETRGPVHPMPEMVERMALPYLQGPDGTPLPASYIRFDVYPAGDIWLTAEDMARFLAVHVGAGEFQGARILSEGSIAEAHTPALERYALGWVVSEKDGDTVIAHSGGVPGFLTHMLGHVEAGVGAYVMSNSGNMAPIAAVAVQLLLGEPYVDPADRAEIELPEETLAEYVGVYKIGLQGLRVRLQEGELWSQIQGQPALRVFAEARDRLFLRDVDCQLEVLRGEDGQVRAIRLHQNGMQTECEKIK